MASSRETLTPLSQFRASQSTASWRYQQVEISGNAMKTITFMDTEPNMFMIQNPTTATLYINLSGIPRENSYEFKIMPNTSKTFGRPVPTQEMCILNPTNADIKINLFSVLDNFDLSILAETHVSIDESVAAEIKGDGICKGFGTGVSLPSGSNHLGEVSIAGEMSVSAELDNATKANIASTASDTAEIKTYSSQIESNMLNVKNNVTGCYENLRDMMWCFNNTYSGTNILSLLLSKLGDIDTAIGQLNLSVQGGAPAETIADTIFYQKENVTSAQTLVFTETVIDGVTESPTERFYANRMLFFSNDGTTDIAIKMYKNSTDYTEIVLKGGESLSNLNIKNPVVTFSPKTAGDSISYRVMYGLAEGA